jgi:quercetin dioxygenase-like cupin family protein
VNTLDIPKLETLKTGETFKIYMVTGQKGMEMPLHYSTREAVVIVQEGSALLAIDGQEYLLGKGNSFIVPAGINHSLVLKSDFKSLVVMALDSKIEFVK